MKFEDKSNFLEYNTRLFQRGNTIKNSLNTFSEQERDHIKQEIVTYYFSKSWGLKLVARNVLGVTYTKCRSIFDLLGIEFRKGRDIVTENLKHFRKTKALYEKDNNIGWQSDNVKRFAKATTRGVQGYYWNKSTNSYYWLRSTYEYIYAKFLNRIGIKWKTETTSYRLSDGSVYHPDFFIYDDDWNLVKIVEIKGYWDVRAYKVDLLREEYFPNSAIDVIIINDIKAYIDQHLTYSEELNTWKQIRKSKEQKSNESQ